jgi:hypothetical protein
MPMSQCRLCCCRPQRLRLSCTVALAGASCTWAPPDLREPGLPVPPPGRHPGCSPPRCPLLEGSCPTTHRTARRRCCLWEGKQAGRQRKGLAQSHLQASNNISFRLMPCVALLASLQPSPSGPADLTCQTQSLVPHVWAAHALRHGVEGPPGASPCDGRVVARRPVQPQQR